MLCGVGWDAPWVLLALPAAAPVSGAAFWVAVATVVLVAVAAETAYRAARRAAKRRAATLARAAAGLLHDLKGPLTVVLANAELLAEAPADPAQRQASLRDVREAVRQMQETLRDLFDFVAGNAQWAPNLVDACGVIEDEARRVASATGGEMARVVCEVKPGIAIHTDERWLRRAIRNLVANALQADATTIWLLGDCDGRSVRLTVSDDGKGMPQDVCARAFEPFYTHGKAHGTGLGMTVVRDVARRSGGAVSCRSVQGRGTEVTLTLPCPGGVGCSALD
jgi:two-component system sensor histidine kinase FlrB